MKMDTFREVVGYNERFPYAGFEDHEFSQRLKDHGITIYMDTKAIMYHNEEDRQSLSKWLERKYRSGITRRVAVEMGYEHLALNYSLLKSLTLSIIDKMRPLLFFVTTNRLINKVTQVDPFTWKIIGYLLASAIYKGYQKEHRLPDA